MDCQSCGMPMAADSDHGGEIPTNPYCKYCTDAVGNLKSKQEVREGMINFHMQSFGKTRDEAEKEVDAHMAMMPAWSVGQEPAQTPVGGTQVPPAPQGPAETPPITETPLPGQTSVPPQEPSIPEEMPPLPETPPQPPAPSTETPIPQTPTEENPQGPQEI